MNRDQIEKIGNMICEIIPVSDEPEEYIEPIMLARALNLLFICHMHRKDERALRRLLAFQDSFVFRNYDLRVLTLCLTKQIFRESDVTAVTEMIILLIKTIWYSHE